jgi:predicted acetyltransferase
VQNLPGLFVERRIARMTVSVRDARTDPADRDWIEKVFRDYLDDLGPLNTGIFPALGEIGHREPDHLQRWYGDPSAALLVIMDDRRRAGFAMVARNSHSTRVTDYRMAEFFIARDSRRRGVGRSAVRLILDRFAGRWEIVEYQRNPGAVSFWRRVVAAYTAGQFREQVINGEVRQTFQSGTARPEPGRL